MRLHIIDGGLEFAMSSQGDIIIYKKTDFHYTLEEIMNSYERYIEEGKNMILKKENYIYIATAIWAWSDDTLITAIMGFLPPGRETMEIVGEEGSILWSKTKFSNGIYYSAIDASVRLHKLDNDLDFTVTNYGDIIIYRTSKGGYTPQEVLNSYNRYISSGFFTREENKEDMKKEDMKKEDMKKGFKLYFGVERATGKQKTVCLWEDGEKTVIRGDKSVLSMPVQYAVAWCYVKRGFKTTSQFKKYVDNHSHILDGITYFEGDTRVKEAQASINNRTKKYDIYDAAALAITAKHYGSVKTIMNYCDGWGE